MSFAAVMPRAKNRRVFGVPFPHLEFDGIALNHEPMDRVGALRTANLASILYY